MALSALTRADRNHSVNTYVKIVGYHTKVDTVTNRTRAVLTRSVYHSETSTEMYEGFYYPKQKYRRKIVRCPSFRNMAEKMV